MILHPPASAVAVNARTETITIGPQTRRKELPLSSIPDRQIRASWPAAPEGCSLPTVGKRKGVMWRRFRQINPVTLLLWLLAAGMAALMVGEYVSHKL